MQEIAGLARTIRPDRVHLNAVTRTPAESFAVSPGRSALCEFAALFEPRAEVIAAAAIAVPQEESVGKRPLIEKIDDGRAPLPGPLAKGEGTGHSAEEET
jgi:hypothetical protein